MPHSSLQEIQARIKSACVRAGRDMSSVTLVGASKMVPAARLEEFFGAGLVNLGENYIQEGIEKVRYFEEKGLEATWHFIGALQSNKAREAVAHFELIHSVDRISLARELDKEALKIGKKQRILLQVNVGGESSKAGVSPRELKALLNSVSAMENLRVEGLMSLPPFQENPEDSRPFHQELRSLLQECGMTGQELSMGMSNDFEVAIEEGATLVRVGTAIFGARR